LRPGRSAPQRRTGFSAMSIERWRGEASVLPPLAGFRELDSLL